MRRTVVSMVRTGAALALALVAAAAVSAQDPTVTIEDAWVVEGRDGPATTVAVKVTSSIDAPSLIRLPWRTVNGSARDTDGDFGPATGTQYFVDIAQGSNEGTLYVSVLDDPVVDKDPTLQMDEAFFIELDSPTIGTANLAKRRATVTIVDNDQSLAALQFVSAVADGPGGVGRVRLQWRVPASTTGPVTDVQVRWNSAPTTGPRCTLPVSTSDGSGGLLSGPPWNQTVNAAGETQVVEHTGLQVDRYHCYALFAVYPGNAFSPPAYVMATPVSSGGSNPVAWAYSVGFYPPPGPFPTVQPPTIGTDAVYAISNDGVVHAMARGESGGTWPKGLTPPEDWRPVALGYPASNRSPVVPLSYGSRLFVGTENGEVHAVDGKNGSIAWSRSAAFGGPLDFAVGGVQATPAGLFKSWGGDNDLILVGTNAVAPNNKLYMLDPETGTDKLAPYTHSSMGAVRGMAAVEYSPGGDDKVFFLTSSPTATLWGLDLTDTMGSPAFEPLAGYPLQVNVGANGSPVFRNGRIYFGAGSALIMYPAPLGGHRVADLANGEIKGFVFPDRRDKRIYLSTTGTVSPSVTPPSVWCLEDTVENEPPLWYTYRWRVADIPTPSIVLHRPNTRFLYVGGGDGHLYEIDVDSPSDPPAKRAVPLEPGSLAGVPSVQIGAPSLDVTYNLVLVGSANGVIYAVHADPSTGIP